MRWEVQQKVVTVRPGAVIDQWAAAHAGALTEWHLDFPHGFLAPDRRYGDIEHEHAGEQQARNVACYEQLADGVVGKRAVDNHVDAGRNEDAQGSAGGTLNYNLDGSPTPNAPSLRPLRATRCGGPSGPPSPWASCFCCWESGRSMRLGPSGMQIIMPRML